MPPAPDRPPRVRVGVVVGVTSAVVAAGALLGQAAWATGVVPAPPSVVVGEPVVIGRPAATPSGGSATISPTTTPPSPTHSPSPTTQPTTDSTHTELPTTGRAHAEPDADDKAQVVSPERVHPVGAGDADADDGAAISGGGEAHEESSEREVEPREEPEKAESSEESESTESHDN